MCSCNVITICVMAVWLLLPHAVWAQHYGDKKYGEHYEEEKVWIETEAAFPEFPRPESLVDFFVSAASPNRYYIAPQTVNVAADGVVRYVAVVMTPSGVINTSFEGLRCATNEVKLYAFGHADSTWSKSRNDRWSAVRPGSYQAALFKEYFCPRGMMILTAGEGVDALRQGGHPLVK